MLLVLLHAAEYPPSFVHDVAADSPIRGRNGLETNLTSVKFGFLADLRVGSQSMKQSLIMDTGSSLLWINCHPCVADAPEPLFDPKSSTSFEIEKCINTDICYGTGAVKLEADDRRGRMSYKVQYGSAKSKGYLARDTFKLGTSPKELDNIVFGCSRSARPQRRTSTGILGFAANRLSLVSQIKASKFSYCLGNVSDESYPYSFLIIGDDIGVFEYKTRLIIENKYYINLESIRVGNKLVAVDPQIFRRNSTYYSGGMIVDTGSTYTYIPGVAFTKFEYQVIKLIKVDSTVTRNYSLAYRGHKMLCYNGLLTRDLQRFPNVYFTFEGGATMELSPENVFYQRYTGSFCLAILPSDAVDLDSSSQSLIGNVMQQFFRVGFDLESKEFMFQKVDCARLV
ncbi:aspartic proteinase nepenthesin-1-like [Salvia miltiorrhiza]|uniref:aspartic proteinase nepenthesin-1-like n=1 Tax=Salvia miltiorrhiza TaxID=226208 RepID=UPI0025AC91EB|nr:aspartic proteinase nepenthesin-1-like [Salvia miltiorrhiza]